MPHAQCLGFLLGYTKFVLYDIFMFGSWILKIHGVVLIVPGSFDIYK